MSQLGLGMTTVTEEPRGRGPGRRGGVAVLVAATVVVAVVAIVLVAVVRWFSASPDYTGSGTGQVIVQIRTGDSISQVAQTLQQDGVVRSTSAFIDVAGSDPSGASIQAGTYRLRLHMSAQDALALLLDPASRVSTPVLVPEGLRTDQTLQVLSKKTKIPVGQLEAVLAAPGQLGLPAYARGNPEGFLFPATYDVAPGMSAQQLLGQMVRRYHQAEADTQLLQRAAAVHLTPYQVIIVASIVQAEGRNPDFPKIARAILNRLAAKMKLQLNSTVNYALRTDKAQLSLTDIAVASPYNTYLVAGLPPGPIDSPGEAAINAVLAPATGNWLYWVTVNPATGETKFTNSYAQFLQFKAELQANTR
jgi:UPF0755 protein